MNACGDCGRPDRSNGVWQAWSHQFQMFLCLDCYERRDKQRRQLEDRSTQPTPVG